MASLQTDLLNGIYFDRCIDLTFYGKDMNRLFWLKTPDVGYKPEIVVKGTLIEGSYSISSFISITNLSYDVNINEVTYIKCRMYYRGLLGKKLGDVETGNYMGHEILFSVLYADQEKEPPNRAIRFQCTVAATDYTRLSSPLFTTAEGEIDNKKISSSTKENSKATTKGVEKPLSTLLEEVARIYNENLDDKFKGGSLDSYDMTIKSISIPNKTIADTPIIMENYNGDIDGYLKILSSKSAVTINGQTINVWKAFVSENRLVVALVPPPNEDWYELDIYQADDLSYGVKSKTVELFYINGAYRNETLISVNSPFDDRIYPGCLCSIMGNAIMGKSKTKSQSSKAFGVRYMPLKDEVITFRATGKIDYEFSTTGRSYMALQGNMVREDSIETYKSWNEGSALRGLN